jgi:hypothetical protein
MLRTVQQEIPTEDMYLQYLGRLEGTQPLQRAHAQAAIAELQAHILWLRADYALHVARRLHAEVRS